MAQSATAANAPPVAPVNGDDALARAWSLRYRHLLGSHRLARVVRPDSTGALGDILAQARQEGVTLWNSCGLPGPVTRDVWLIDFAHMNRIVDIDAANATALVEPGVSHAQLAAELGTRKLPFLVDAGRDPRASVAGDILARRYGYTPYGDRALMQCGLEVMLADGLLVRTGMGAMSKSNMFQLFKWGFGPVNDGLFMQSRLGIVTKVGLWLMPAAPRCLPFMASLRDEAALEAAMDILRPLSINRILPHPVAVASKAWEAAYVPGDADEADLGDWNVFGALYGLPDDVDLLWGMVQAQLGAVPGAHLRLIDDVAMGHPPLAARAHMMRGEVSADAMPPMAGEKLEIAAVGGIHGDDARAMAALARRMLDAAGLPPRIEFQLCWRALLAKVELPWQDAASLERARTTAGDILAAWAQAGYAPSHTDDGVLEPARARLAGTGQAHVHALLAAALDPSGVLSGTPA
ncbi:FAD-binding oxidoreductase [Aerosticca soli]|uniref:FAD-binding oxidoreductase n=1 Tax=Aerosticca soli TaxID=2010829 RepID=UPI001386FC21|nr:FAD-dependent oxidoreductase [Aerosticca soli]